MYTLVARCGFEPLQMPCQLITPVNSPLHTSGDPLKKREQCDSSVSESGVLLCQNNIRIFRFAYFFFVRVKNNYATLSSSIVNWDKLMEWTDGHRNNKTNILSILDSGYEIGDGKDNNKSNDKQAQCTTTKYRIYNKAINEKRETYANDNLLLGRSSADNIHLRANVLMSMIFFNNK
uniref:Uncharacterized protein n=1 Tax=Glossina pallidipes TaxID=7398 RepID=A0A1A9ZI74_GLOPL